MRTQYKEELFQKMPVIGILRNFSLTEIEAILPYYKKAGFTMLEVTMNSSKVLEIISHLANNNSDLNIGAGTVCNMEDLIAAIQAGASFIVTPIMDVNVMHYCKEHKIPVFPGAFTPSEIFNAAQLGATAVKIFPATALGPVYVKDVLAPMSTLKILPTGGVSIDNIESYFKAGAIGVGMGGSLFDEKMIANKDYDSLYHHFVTVCELVTKARI
jgi:2-dehydro-3-deoxyphosphogluconate aldolase/(4S)-4-hydroxy-2-oxoglutarate aldolase